MKIPLIIASDFGSIGIVELIAKAFWIILPLSIFSLILVIPKKIRKYTKWMAWSSVAGSLVGFILVIYLLSLMGPSAEPDWIFGVAIAFLPLLLSCIALLISLRKNQNEKDE